MTQKSWPWSTVAALGDGGVELGESGAREFLAKYFLVQDPAVEGVSKGVLGELEVSGVTSPLSVAAGSAVCFGLYISDAAEALAVSTPAVGTTGGRVVLQTNWAGTGGAGLEARTRIALKMSADGSPAIPALTQSEGTTWEVSLATIQITTGGDITVTDDRTFRRTTGVVQSADIIDLEVNTGDLANNAVTNTKLRDSSAVSIIGRAANSAGDPADIAAGSNDRVLRRVSNALDFGQLTAGMVPNLLITEAMLAAAAAAKLVTNGNTHDHNGGDGANIPAGGLADGAVNTTAKLANDVVDDTKVGNRVPQFYRRQGGNATSWPVAGTTSYTPGAVRMQAGVVLLENLGSSSGIVTVTFPQAFSNLPIVIPFFDLDDYDGTKLYFFFTQDVSATQVKFGFVSSGTYGWSGLVRWLAIGPE